jgi:arylsulfatase A-like enzyme
MSQTASSDRPVRRFAGLPLALALAMGLLVATASQVAVTFAELTPDWSSLSSTLDLRLWSTPLGGEIVFFIAAQLLVHLGFGLLVWLLARSTLFVLPRLQVGIRWLTAAWFGVGVVWVLVANATLYPWSSSGFHSKLLLDPVFGQMRLFDLLTLVVAAVVVGLLAMAIRAVPPLRAIVPRALAYGAIVVAVALTVQFVQASGGSSSGGNTQPNIIVIGIDSLRPDVIGSRDRLGITPNLDVFLNGGAHEFKDAITPLARTYPSWMSVLSGQYPRTHGIRENLMPRPTEKGRELLPDIDASYGFDTVLTPTIGAADFLLGSANDLPLPNLLANTVAGRVLFPATYANRAAAHTYRPATFTSWLRDEIEPSGPQMLAIHLTLPHWPYRWSEREDQIFDLATDRQYLYLNAVIAADRQFGELMRILENKGMLENALVVVLSDHGEALGMPAEDALLRGAVAKEMIGNAKIALWGHGSGVLSPNQYATFLAVRGYGKAELPPSRSHQEPVALVDIAPTVLDLAHLPASGHHFDGMSLGPLLVSQDAQLAARLRERPRFTETGYRTPLLDAEHIDEAAIVGNAAAFFEMNPVNGRFEVRKELLQRLMQDKERAAFTKRWLLAAIPIEFGADRTRYVLIDRQSGPPRRLVQAPDANAEPEVARLWAAFHQHYGDELLPPLP